MPQVFPVDDELDVECGLMHAYDLIDEPKPSLNRVMGLLKDAELTGRKSDAGVWRVPSVSQFASEISDWVKNTGYSRFGAGIYTPVPEGYAAITKFCRDNVSPTIGSSNRLFQPGSKPPVLSSYARDLIQAGDVDGAMLVGHGIWAAKPVAVKIWLDRRFGIRTR